MSDPKSDNIRPIYGGKVDTPKMYINGHEVPPEIFELYRKSIFDCESGVLYTYGYRGEE